MARNDKRRNTPVPATTPDVSVDTAAPVAVTVPTVPDVPTLDTYDATVATIADDAVRAVMASPGARAIAAGLAAVRYTADTPDAIRAAVSTFVDAATAVHPAHATMPTVGRFMGRSVYIGQNTMYAIAAIMRVPDTAIIAGWAAEWPNARCDYPAHSRYIRSTRTDVNHGKHGWTRDDVARYGGPFVRWSANGTNMG
jgi:hypothetical protein